ncbi:MAG TPA: M23 family metallopeptidase [Thiotrichales bacterium]|nr:M23 family metallopeptidase [Thiotrichales bacterium]
MSLTSITRFPPRRNGVLFLSLGLLLALVAAGGLWAGYRLGLDTRMGSDREAVSDSLRQALAHQRHELERTRIETRAHLDALAQRLGVMQSRLMRLDALGEELARRGSLDPAEFNFGQEPARGGIETPAGARSVALGELVSEMEQLSRSIEDRESKLSLLEQLILNSRLEAQLLPAGRPVEKGWISSAYGWRKDPFSGKKNFHHGVDIAGKPDSEVTAVAAGVVTFAGRKSGYGQVVEVRHADGYTTKYAHNSKLLVGAGALVSKGDVIALMGSTGRSTGPHVHFEIARNGKSVNPLKYLRRDRKKK